MNEDKMHDEMIENGKGSGGIEAGLGEEDGKMMRTAVLKMDCRYVSFALLFCRKFFVADMV